MTGHREDLSIGNDFKRMRCRRLGEAERGNHGSLERERPELDQRAGVEREVLC